MRGLNKGPILVTGASGGIGGATVKYLVAEGAKVIASGRDEEKLAAVLILKLHYIVLQGFILYDTALWRRQSRYMREGEAFI